MLLRFFGWMVRVLGGDADFWYFFEFFVSACLRSPNPKDEELAVWEGELSVF